MTDTSKSNILAKARLAVYAPHEFGKTSKTAEGVIRYGSNPIACVIDPSQKGRSIADIVKIDCPAPIVGSIAEARLLSPSPQALLLGTAWAGGSLPQSWLDDIREAIKSGWHIINGLHDFLGENAEIAALAQKHGVELLDVRSTPKSLPVASRRVMGLPQSKAVILTVGNDCSVGKMTASLELHRLALNQGIRSAFVATGQTGIMIDGGQGISIDRVIGDFMAGATEMMVSPDLIFVEGQGSLAHPGFSGVTMALLHGSCPHGMILCLRASQTKIKGTDFDLSPLPRLIESYEQMAAYQRPARVLGIAVNTRDLDDMAAADAIARIQARQDCLRPIRSDRKPADNYCLTRFCQYCMAHWQKPKQKDHTN